MKDASGHGSNPRGQLAAHQSGIGALALGAHDLEPDVEISRIIREGEAKTAKKMASRQLGEAWIGLH